MLKILALIVIVLLVETGCRKKEKCDPDTYQFYFKNNAKVDTSTRNGQAPVFAFAGNGNKRVFSYLHAHSPCNPAIVDGFTTASLLFEADPSLPNFILKDEDLVDAHCYYAYFLDGYDGKGAYTPTAGTIEGVKISETAWQVSFDLKLAGNQQLTGAGRFVVQ